MASKPPGEADALPPVLSIHGALTAAPALLRSFPMPVLAEANSMAPLSSAIPEEHRNDPIPDVVVALLVSKAKENMTTTRSFEYKIGPRAPRRAALDRQARKVFDELHNHTSEQRAQLGMAPARHNHGREASGSERQAAGDALLLLADDATDPAGRHAMTLRPRRESVVPDVLRKKAARAEPRAGPPSQPPAVSPAAKPTADTRASRGAASATPATPHLPRPPHEGAVVASVMPDAEQRSRSVALDAATKWMLTETPSSLITAFMAGKGSATPVLVALSNAVLGAATPYTDEICTNDEVMPAFLAKLVEPSTDDDSDEHGLAAATRALVFFTCTSHPTFQSRWLRENAVDAAIDRLMSVARWMRRRVAALGALDRALPQALVRAAECSRAACIGAAALVFGGALTSTVQLARLEDVSAAYLLIHTDLGPEAALALGDDVARYIGAASVELYQALCCVARGQARDSLADAFLTKLRPKPAAARRVIDVGGASAAGRDVGALALALIAAAQGLPAPHHMPLTSHNAPGGAEDGALVLERCHGTVRAWIAAVLGRFFSVEALKGADAETRDSSLTIVVTLAEDLATMASLPQFPAADFALRALSLALVRAHLSDSQTSHGAAAPLALLERLRATAVDALGRAAAVLLRISTATVEVGLGQQAAGVPESALREWQLLLAGPAAPVVTPGEIQRKKKRREPAAAPLPELSQQEVMQCVAFHEYSRLAHQAPPGTCSWLCARQYAVALWACEPGAGTGDGGSPAMSPLSPVEGRALPFTLLARLEPSDTASRTASVAESFAALTANLRGIAAHRPRSMLSSGSAESLVRAVLRVLRDGGDERSDEGGDNAAAAPIAAARTAGWDSARRVALRHLGVLVDVHPPLLAAAWTVVRQCVCTDATRVRDSSLALIQTLLGKVEAAAAAGSMSEAMSLLGCNLISALLHLLQDRSPTISAKAVAVIASDVVTSAALALDPALCRFVLSSLLDAFSLSATNTKLRLEICVIFAKRWLRNSSGTIDIGQQGLEAALLGSNTDGEGNAAVLQDRFSDLAEELQHLAIRGLEPPFEVSEDHSLVQLLRLIVSTAAAAAGQGEAKGGARGGRGSGGGRRKEAEVVRLAGGASSASAVIRSVARYLLQRAAAAVSDDRHEPEADNFCAPRILAAIHLLALAHADWVAPFVEAIEQQYLRLPQDLSSLSEARRICLLHATAIVHCVLQQSVAPVPQQSVASLLTHVLNRYVGPHQQKILLAAAGGLCAMIEPGVAVVGSRPNKAYLGAVYSLMNQYFVRAKALLPTVGADASHVAYALRFVFLLSEFLRLYPWHKWGAELGRVDTGAAPNELAGGPGILENSHRLGTVLADRIPETARQRTFTIVVRLIGSLCISQPTVFLRRSEGLLHTALEHANEPALHVQALSVLRDFLVDEERRLDAATTATAVPASAGGEKPPLAAALVAGVAEDHNSGMTTWALQRFHKEVIALTLSHSAACRHLALEVIELAIHQGLLAPSIFVEPLLSLVADPGHETLRARAAAALKGLCERLDDTVTPRAVAGVIRGFDLVLRLGSGAGAAASGVVNASDVVPHLSVFADVFPFIASCRKRREGFLGALMRSLYLEGKINEWCGGHLPGFAERCGGAPKVTNSVVVDSAPLVAPVQLMAFLARALAFLPFSMESEALFMFDQIRCGVDLSGEASLQQLEKRVAVKAATLAVDVALCVEVAQAAGVLLLLHIKTYLRREFGLTAAKMARRAQNGGIGQALLPHREPRSRASVDFISHVGAVVDLVSPLAPLRLTDAPRRGRSGAPFMAALRGLLDALREALEEDSKDAMLLVYPSGADGPDMSEDGPRKAAALRRRTGARQRPQQRRPQHSTHRRRRGKSGDDDYDESEDDDVTSPSSSEASSGSES